MLSNKVIYDGKAKTIIESENQSHVIQHFKDSVTAFNKQMCDIVKDKGIINNYISASIMTELEKQEINTHFLKLLSEREQLVKKLKIIPIEVVVRNISAGSFCNRFNIKEGQSLSHPIIEFFYKDDELSDPMINENHIAHYLKCLTYQELQKIQDITLKINVILKSIFSNVDIILVDIKLEFGKTENSNEIILADEISPDNCRLWDNNTKKKLDKDVFRLNLGNVKETYLEVANRLHISLPSDI